VRWRLKAAIQRSIARLPRTLGDRAYYALQATFGQLRTIRPLSRIERAAEVLRRANTPVRRAIEIGTGWVPVAPITLWLAGADEVLSVDLNRYLKDELTMQAVRWMRANRGLVEAALGDVATDFDARFTELRSIQSATDLYERIRFRYLAPADAQALPVPDGWADLHFSITVLEHVPVKAIRRILAEGRRCTRPGGTLVHFIDPSDHFSHSDPTITTVNFLRFSDAEWERLAGNRFAFHNRLRLCDYESIWADRDARITSVVDETAVAALEGGLIPLAGRDPRRIAALEVRVAEPIKAPVTPERGDDFPPCTET